METSGGPLPPPVHGVFNLEVWTGNPADAPTHPPHGYQGLAVLQGGREIDLISGAFAVTDPGNGHDTINADGTDETINGGAASVTLNLFGNRDVASGGDNNTISVFGDHDTANGSRNDAILVYGTHDLVHAGKGQESVTVFGRHDTVKGGLGNEQIYVFGSHDRVIGGIGNESVDLFGRGDDFSGGLGSETVNALGSGDSVSAGIGDAKINVAGDANTVHGGIGDDTINVVGNHDLVVPGAGIADVDIAGRGDSIDAGNHPFVSEAHITVGGSDFRFNDGPQTYFDTIVGFDQHAGDRIHLATESVHDALAHSKQVNGGHDTLITLNDGSTILLKGISHINAGFFG